MSDLQKNPGPAVPAPAIIGFIGPYRFLSNFYPAVVSWHGRMFPTVEHAFQAAKATQDHERDLIANCKTPGQAKKLGRVILCRPDWDDIKLDLMLLLLRRKFSLTDLRPKLLKTGNAHLYEENYWGDVFWGTMKLKGENHLGRLLMQVRTEIQSGKEAEPYDQDQT